MDCDAFRASEIDALYGELDAAASAAMESHAAGCEACATRMQKLRATRSAFAPLVVATPPGLEAKIEAAVARAEAAKRSGAGGGGGGTVIRFFARPQLALAAGFVLVAGAALLYGGAQMRSAASAASVADKSEPAQGAASAAGESAPAPPPAAMAMATASAAAPPEDPAFAAARAAYESGQLAEACPQLDALAKTNDAAALYAARCTSRTKGCAAAAPRFDAVAQRNVGNETGARAQLEAARCYRAMGDPRAGARYAALKDDAFVGDDAKADLAPPAIAARKAAPPPPAAVAQPAATSTAGSRAGGAARPAAKPKPADATMGF